MIDIILFVAVLGIWFFGFWCGAKYKTLSALGARVKALWT